MATTSATTGSNQTLSTTTISSALHNTVCLQDWWLVKAERDFHGKRLAVGGIASRERQAIRAFCSAPITKRLDTFTLETADGVTIMVKGFINRSRTHENGFSPEVCNNFLFGFPYYWEDYTGQHFGGECSTGMGVAPTSISGFNKKTMNSSHGVIHAPPLHVDEFPVTKIRDLLMSTLGSSYNSELTKNIFTDMLEKCNSNDVINPGVSVHSDMRSSSAPVAGASFPEKAPSKHKKAKRERKHEIDKAVLDPKFVVPEVRIKVPLTEKQDNLNHDGWIEPENEGLKGNSSMMKSDDIIDDAANDSILRVNTEVSLFEAEPHMPNLASNRNEAGRTGSSKRKHRYNKGLERNYLTRSKRLESLESERKDEKKTKFGSKSANLNMVNCVEKKSNGSSSSLVSVGSEGIVDKSLSSASKVGHTKISERLANCNFDSVADPSSRIGSVMKLGSPSKMDVDTINFNPGKSVATRSNDRLRKSKNDCKEDPTSGSCVKRRNNEPSYWSLISEDTENPCEQVAGSTSNMNILSPGKTGSSSKAMVRRSSTRLKNLKNKSKET